MMNRKETAIIILLNKSFNILSLLCRVRRINLRRYERRWTNSRKQRAEARWLGIRTKRTGKWIGSGELKIKRGKGGGGGRSHNGP